MLAGDSRHGWLFPQRRHEDMMKYACANLLTLLGCRARIFVTTADWPLPEVGIADRQGR